eukprot:TRINITY_DN146_c0_g1_i4.p1 TRINITY_DN146_c0_g1~~TRINITY_DN146_c0_g1_i4.p1  ORF type:complete len:140 (-),score=31.28 TRINITY_DN146_c0_g1_i4:70-465(-)
MSGQLRASHILIKHEGSRRLSSWKDPMGERIRETTKEEAVNQLLALRKEIDGKADKFEEVAKDVSDCGSAQDGGDLGWFGPGEMYENWKINKMRTEKQPKTEVLTGNSKSQPETLLLEKSVVLYTLAVEPT